VFPVLRGKLHRMKFTAHQRRRVCVAAPCDERTFDKWARDRGRVSELARVRIERAVRELRLDDASEWQDARLRP
jgi:hypothetical protein